MLTNAEIRVEYTKVQKEIETIQCTTEGVKLAKQLKAKTYKSVGQIGGNSILLEICERKKEIGSWAHSHLIYWGKQ
jgi:hypothetical protein